MLYQIICIVYEVPGSQVWGNFEPNGLGGLCNYDTFDGMSVKFQHYFADEIRMNSFVSVLSFRE